MEAIKTDWNHKPIRFVYDEMGGYSIDTFGMTEAETAQHVADNFPTEYDDFTTQLCGEFTSHVFCLETDEARHYGKETDPRKIAENEAVSRVVELVKSLIPLPVEQRENEAIKSLLASLYHLDKNGYEIATDGSLDNEPDDFVINTLIAAISDIRKMGE